jgi:hypothetical protein
LFKLKSRRRDAGQIWEGKHRRRRQSWAWVCVPVENESERGRLDKEFIMI